MGPQPEQTVTESGELHQHAQKGQQDIGLNGEKVIGQVRLFEFFLPMSKLFTVGRRNAEGLNGIEVIKGFHFESHHLTVHFLHFFAIVPLLFN